MTLGRPPADVTQSLALDANALAGLRRQARESPEQALSKAAGQFEALFLNMVLKQMRASLPKDGPLDSDTMRTYTSMFDQQIAQHLSSRGIGLRDALERQLAKRIGSGEAPKPPSAPAGGARIDGPKALAPLAPSAPTAAPAAASPGVASRIQSFIDNLRPHAEKAAVALGVPAQLLIAQAGLETGWGRSQPRNADGSVSHNLFGVKATSRWNGATVAAATTEFVQGTAVRAVEKFRAYGSYADAFSDLTRVLGSKRYAGAIANANDPAAYARSLQQAGYATDPSYADKLTRAIHAVTRQLSAGMQPDRARLAQAAPIQDSAPAADIRSNPAA
jgi:flagellar protein FlgJ